MVETFIRESKKGDRFRSDEACRSSLSSIVHDEVFIFRKNKREVEVKRPRCGEDRGWIGLRRDNWTELWGVPLGGLQVSENESAESRWDKNGEVRGWDGFVTAHVDLIPDANWSPAMLSVVPAPPRGETARVQAWLRWACQKRGDVRGRGVVGGCKQHGAGQRCHTIASDKSLSQASRMVWAGTSTGIRPERPESRCARDGVPEMGRKDKVNRDRGPGIGERKLGWSDVMFLIYREGRMVDGREETIQSGFNFWGVGDFTFDGWTFFFLDYAALVITTVAVMKICYNGHRLITRSNRLVSGQQKSKETQTNRPNNQPKPTKSDQSVKVRQVKHVCALTTWCIAQKPRLSQHLQQLVECHTSNTWCLVANSCQDVHRVLPKQRQIPWPHGQDQWKLKSLACQSGEPSHTSSK